MLAHAGDGPTRLRIKICGITNAADAHAAIAFGADALGLNCYAKSKRYLEVAAAGDWLSELPADIAKIAVVVNARFEEAVAIAQLPFITGLQLHGSESPEFCAQLLERGIAFAKALPVTDENSLDAAPSFSTCVVVLDSAREGTFGGSGHTFPWHVARKFIEERPELKVILAGGLTPENVVQAVGEIRPFAVDVTSGVESSAGRKDHGRLRAFIEAARSAG